MPGNKLQQTLSRRSFIKTSAATGAALAAGPCSRPPCMPRQDPSSSATSARRRGRSPPSPRPTTSCSANSARTMKGGLKVGNATRPIEVVVRDSQSNPNRAAEVAKELIVRDKVDLMLVASTPETTNPVSHAVRDRGGACISTNGAVAALVHRPAGQPGGGPPAWKPFNYAYHYFWGLEDVIAVFTNMWNQVSTNKSVGGLFPNDGDGNAWGDKQVGFPPVLEKAGLQAHRSGPLPEPHRQLLGADHRLQERQLRDRHRRGAAAGLHHVLEAGAAAGLQAEGRLGRQGDPVPRGRRGAGPRRPQSVVGGVVVAEPSLQVLADRPERQAARRRLHRRHQEAVDAADRLHPFAVRGGGRRAQAHAEIGNAKATVRGDRCHQPRHGGRQGAVERRRLAAVCGQERHQDPAGRRAVAGRRTATSTTSSSPTTRPRPTSPSAARWKRSPRSRSVHGAGHNPGPEPWR